MTAIAYTARPRLSNRVVMFDRETGLYLGHDCLSTTAERVWAWSGSTRQGRNAREVFPLARDMTMYWDGEERG
jgi:hypothetical protein